MSHTSHPIPGWKDKPLFTPGPLTTSRAVKQAMLRDVGSRDFEFIDTVKDIRQRLVALGGGGPFEAVPLQGSGTYAVEAMFSSGMPRGGKVLIAANGAYGKRMEKIVRALDIDHVLLEFPEHTFTAPERIAEALDGETGITHLAVVHCETTTGIMNPVEAIGGLAASRNLVYMVDAMSSFGAVPLNLDACHIDFLVSSANKCIEGVPGFGFVLARRSVLEATKGYARSVSLDLYEQWRGLEDNGQFRFTPPTHVLLAFHQALLELEAEGGIAGRAARYQNNYHALVEGMRALGFVEYLPPELQGYIITSFRYPKHPAFDFNLFYAMLNDMGFVIYPGKVSDADCFRIGNIGRLDSHDVAALLAAIARTLNELNVTL